MASYGLKTNITVNIALILFFGMGLTAFMTTNVIEHLLVKSHIKKGRMLLTVIQNTGKSKFALDGELEKTIESERLLHELFQDSDGACAVIVNKAKDLYYNYGADCGGQSHLRKYASEAAETGRYIETTHGDAWGVFWKQKRTVVMAAPLYYDNNTTMGVALSVPLSRIYDHVRHAQKLIFLYVLINGLLLTLVGVHQITKRVIKPIQRLLKRAEDYHGENKKNLIFDEKGGNEFNKLSTALNNMLGRISDDRAKLTETVVSLEKTNRELKQAQADIIRAEKLASVGRLSSGIAHEIGNPLGIVSGYLELIKPSDVDETKRQDYITRAESELSRIDRIIRQLLDYSRTSPPTLAYFSAHETMTDVAEMLRIQPIMSGSDIELKLDAKKDRIKGDADKFKQVLMNLALNALDAIALRKDDSPGRIIFESENLPAGEFHEDEGPLLRISVSDNGIGIPKNTLNTIFDPFFTTKEPGKGTGLGLSVCFTILQDLGGRIKVDSEEGKGTRMDMFFPLPQSSKHLSLESYP